MVGGSITSYKVLMGWVLMMPLGYCVGLLVGRALGLALAPRSYFDSPAGRESLVNGVGTNNVFVLRAACVVAVLLGLGGGIYLMWSLFA